MTNQEYEQKKRECWENFKFARRPLNTDKKVFDYIFDRAYALGKQEKDAKGSKGKLMCLRDRTKVCNKCHACDIDADAWYSMYSR